MHDKQGFKFDRCALQAAIPQDDQQQELEFWPTLRPGRASRTLSQGSSGGLNQSPAASPLGRMSSMVSFGLHVPVQSVCLCASYCWSLPQL